MVRCCQSDPLRWPHAASVTGRGAKRRNPGDLAEASDRSGVFTSKHTRRAARVNVSVA